MHLLSFVLSVGCSIHYDFNKHLWTGLITHAWKCRFFMKKGNYWVYAFLILMNTAHENGSVGSDSLWPHGLSPWNSSGQNTWVGSFSVLQGIFWTQGSNPGLPNCRWILCQLSHKGRTRILKWVAYPFSRGSSLPRNRTGVSWILYQLSSEGKQTHLAGIAAGSVVF